MNIWNSSGGGSGRSSPTTGGSGGSSPITTTDYIASYNPTPTNLATNTNNGSDSSNDSYKPNHLHSKIEPTELTTESGTNTETTSTPTQPTPKTEPTPQPEVDAGQSFSTRGSSPNPLFDSKPELTVTPDGADTKVITRRIIGTPPSSPITSRSKLNNQLIIGTPPDSPSKIKTSHVIIGTPPDSPTSTKNKTNMNSNLAIPGETAKNKHHLALIPDSASDIKGNNTKTNNKLRPTTPPDSPGSMKSKSTSKLNHNTPPDSPSALKSKSAGKLNLSPSPYSSDGEVSDVDENSHSPTPKKKGSMLNLFAFSKLSPSSSPSSSPSGLDDEKQSIWQRATKKFNSSPKQSDVE
jgi:hypothetical protein